MCQYIRQEKMWTDRYDDEELYQAMKGAQQGLAQKQKEEKLIKAEKCPEIERASVK